MSLKKHFSPEEDDLSSKTLGRHHDIRSFQTHRTALEDDANDLEGVENYNSAAKLLIGSTEHVENRGIQLENLNKNSIESGSQTLKKSRTVTSTIANGSQKTKRPNKPLTKVSTIT